MTQQEIQDQLTQLEEAIANLEAMHDTLSDEQLQAALAPLQQKRKALKTELRLAQASQQVDIQGSGTVAQGDHATAVSEGGVNVTGNVQGPIITGSGNTILTGPSAADASTPLPPQFAPLRQLIVQYFSLEELHTIAFDLGISHDDLSGETRSGFSKSLIGYCYRNNKLPQLIKLCQQQRDFIDWPNVS